MVDIGAAYGYYTLTAAKVVGNEGKVYAFEPNPRLFKILLRNIQINKLSNVLALNKAISDKHSLSRFYIFRGLESSLIDVRGENEEPLEDIIEVETITLDGFFHENARLDVVKVDVEGAEVRVLRRMRRLLEKPKMKMFIEFNPSLIMNAGHDPKELTDVLVKYGFTIYVIWEDKRETECVKNIDMLIKRLLEKRSCVNLLCIKHD